MMYFRFVGMAVILSRLSPKLEDILPSATQGSCAERTKLLRKSTLNRPGNEMQRVKNFL